MVTSEQVMEFLHNSSKDKVLESRKIYKENNGFNDFLYKASKKILMKITFPYCRLELLLNCFADIIDNSLYYPNVKPHEMEEIKTIFDKLQKICLYLNVALDEFIQIMANIENVFKKNL